eukprot:GHVU01018965.1.p1 GENE.GHVU01018965.1~~GHVU01018965.1.p1  ORF type:complete len:381 (+),score=52.71 GHVU01018965.1:1-1143(+)
MLVLFAILVSASQYVGDPIKCWTPAHFEDGWNTYTNNYCWVRNTYYLPWENNIPNEKDMDDENKAYTLKYYQYVPIILMVQAVMFYMPICFWRALNFRSGIDVNDVVETSEKVQRSKEDEDKKKTMDFLARNMDRFLNMSKRKQKAETIWGKFMNCLSLMACCMGKRLGNYLVILYMFIKVFFLINIVLQLVMLNSFLGIDFTTFGANVAYKWYYGEDWTMNPERFPRATMCNFKIRRLGNVQRYTVQCALPINLFNEKIFLIIWFWIFLLAIITFLNFIQWFWTFCDKGGRHEYVAHYLKKERLYDSSSDDERKCFVQFMDNYLRQDGVFVLRLVDLNTNPVVVREFFGQLWNQYKNEYRKNHDGEDKPLKPILNNIPE